MAPGIHPSTHRAVLAYQASQPGITYDEALYAIEYTGSMYGGTSGFTARRQGQDQAAQSAPTAQALAARAKELMQQARGPGRAISASQAVAMARRELATA
jgi:hypothetical protein